MWCNFFGMETGRCLEGITGGVVACIHIGLSTDTCAKVMIHTGKVVQVESHVAPYRHVFAVEKILHTSCTPPESHVTSPQ